MLFPAFRVPRCATVIAAQLLPRIADSLLHNHVAQQLH